MLPSGSADTHGIIGCAEHSFDSPLKPPRTVCRTMWTACFFGRAPWVALPSCASGGRRPGFKKTNQENMLCLPSHSWLQPRRPRRRCFSVAFQPEAK